MAAGRPASEPGADGLYRVAIEIFGEIFGNKNPAIMYALAGRAQLLEYKCEIREAEALASEALVVARQLLPKDDARIGARMLELSIIHQEMGKAGAGSEGEQGFEIMRAKLGEWHPDYSWAMERLAHMKMQAGDSEANSPNGGLDAERAASTARRRISPMLKPIPYISVDPVSITTSRPR